MKLDDPFESPVPEPDVRITTHPALQGTAAGTLLF